MNRLYIPELGTVITLAEDWTFDVIREHRNTSLYDSWKDCSWEEAKKDKAVCKLPKGTVLVIDRIYIRKGQTDFNSVSFNIPAKFYKPDDIWEFVYNDKYSKTKAKKSVRFFVKLADANTMMIE